MKNVLDLRFVIGAFFSLTGIFLLIASFVMQPDVMFKSETVNRWCGLLYIVFGVVMLVLWRSGKNANKEQ